MLDTQLGTGGVGHCVFVTEIRNSRLRPYTETNGGKSLKTRILPSFRHRFLKNYRSNTDKFWNTDRKRYFEGYFPSNLRGFIEKF